MRPLKFPAPSRATLLWLAVALGSAFVWWFSLRPSSASESLAGLVALVLGISAIYGLPISLLMPRARRITEEGCARPLFLFFIGGVLGVGAVHLAYHLPTLPWEAAPRPPEPITELVAPTFSDSSHGSVVAATSSRTLYLFECVWECEWTATEVVPPLPEPNDMSSGGRCWGGSQEPGESIAPPPPGRVLDSASIRYCGGEADIETFFILTDDGTLWRWSKMWTFYDSLVLSCVYPVSILIGSVVAFMWGPRE